MCKALRWNSINQSKICLSCFEIKNLHHFSRRGCLLQWYEPESSFLWPQFVFLRELNFLLLSAFPPKGRQPGLCALSSLDLSWFSKSPGSRLDMRMKQGIRRSQHMLRPQLGPHERGCHWTHISVLQPHAAFFCFPQETPETLLTVTGKREFLCRKWKRLLPYVAAT